jgi:hypothetical protein
MKSYLVNNMDAHASPSIAVLDWNPDRWYVSEYFTQGGEVLAVKVIGSGMSKASAEAVRREAVNPYKL